MEKGNIKVNQEIERIRGPTVRIKIQEGRDLIVEIEDLVIGKKKIAEDQEAKNDQKNREGLIVNPEKEKLRNPDQEREGLVL